VVPTHHSRQYDPTCTSRFDWSDMI